MAEELSWMQQIPYILKGGKVVLEDAPDIFSGVRYAGESAKKHGFDKPVGKRRFINDTNQIVKDAVAVINAVRGADWRLQPYLKVVEEYAELYVRMIDLIQLYLNDLEPEDYNFGNAYEIYIVPVQAINYILAKLIKNLVFAKRHNETFYNKLPNNLKDLIETVERETVQITLEPEDYPKKYNANYERILKDLKEGKSMKFTQADIEQISYAHDEIPAGWLNKLFDAERKMIEKLPAYKHLQMFPFVLWGECYRDMDREAYDKIEQPAQEMLDIGIEYANDPEVKKRVKEEARREQQKQDEEEKEQKKFEREYAKEYAKQKAKEDAALGQPKFERYTSSPKKEQSPQRENTDNDESSGFERYYSSPKRQESATGESTENADSKKNFERMTKEDLEKQWKEEYEQNKGKGTKNYPQKQETGGWKKHLKNIGKLGTAIGTATGIIPPIVSTVLGSLLG